MDPEQEIAEILAAWRERCDRGQPEEPEAVVRRHPELADALRSHFEALRAVGQVLRTDRAADPRDSGAAADPPLRPLARDRYVDFEPIGQGGMGIVYWAIDTDLNRVVAFKVVRPRGEKDAGVMPPDPEVLTPPAADTPASSAFETLRRRFLREAWVTGRLEHPGIVPVYELGQTAEGIPYYTMRFVRGSRTLAETIEGADEQDMQARLLLLDPFLKVCDTIQYAHSRGVVHRDLKPQNIALGEFGEVVVLDWGLARVLDEPDLRRDHWQERLEAYRLAPSFETVSGVLGTPGHMAPEAAAGDVDAVDARSDVYSLGTILFQILTGGLPYEGRNYVELLRKMTRVDAPAAQSLRPEVPTALSDICGRALARRPEDRPPSAEAIASSIREWRAQSAVERRVEGWLRDAKTGLRVALRLRGAGLLHQLDDASGPLRNVLAVRPDHPTARSYQRRLAALRERGIRERVRGSRRRLLSVVGIAALVLATIGGWYGYGLLKAERDTAVQQEARAVEAEADATERLWESYVAQARAWRQTPLPGRRSKSLQAIRRASSIRPGPTLRDEAMACLTLTDLRFVRQLRVTDEPNVLSAYDPTRGRYACADAQGTITLRSLEDDQVLLRIPGPGPFVAWTLRFSPDGRYLASVYAYDDSLWVWDAETGALVFRTDEAAHRDAVGFMSDASCIAVGHVDGTVRIHALPSGDCVRELDGVEKPFCLRFGPDGRRLAVSSLDAGTLAILDVESGGEVARIQGGVAPRYLAWSPDGQSIAVGSGSDVQLWSWREGALTLDRVLRQHSSVVSHLAYSHSGRLLATGGWEGWLCLWDAAAGRLLLAARPGDAPLGFGPDDRKLVLTRQLWEVTEPTAFRRLPPLRPARTVEGWRCAAVDPNGQFVVDWRPEGPVIRELRTGTPLARLPIGPAHFLVHPEGHVLVTAGRGGVLRWPIRRDTSSCRIGPPVPFEELGAEPAWRVMQSADGSTLAAWLTERRQMAILRDWHRPAEGAGPKLHVIHLPGHWLRASALSPDGEVLATRVRESTDLHLIETRTGVEHRGPLETTISEVGPAFSPDGRWLIARMRRGLRIWRTEDWACHQTCLLSPCLGAALFTPDGSLLAVGGGEVGIRFLETSSGDVVSRLGTDPVAGASPVAISPDGCLFAARIGAAGELAIWDFAALREELRALGLDWEDAPCHTRPVPIPGDALSIEVDLGTLADPGAPEVAPPGTE